MTKIGLNDPFSKELHILLANTLFQANRCSVKV